MWRNLDTVSDLLALAPEDEILAEMLALHSELLQQIAINRSRTAKLLQLSLEDVPNQLKASSQRQLGVDFAKAWIAVSLCSGNILYQCVVGNPDTKPGSELPNLV